MKQQFVALLFSVALSEFGFGATPPEPSPEVKAILDRTGNFDTPNFRAVQALNEDERQLLLTFFREQYRVAHSAEPLSNIKAIPEHPTLRSDLKMRSETALAMLADPELMPGWIRDAKQAPAGSEELGSAVRGIVLAAKPELVVELAPFIMTGEPVTSTYVDDTRSYTTKNVTAGHGMLAIIKNSPAFDGQIRKWAQDQLKAPAELLLKMLPQWWKDNEAHFIAKDYKSVKPGEDIYNPVMENARRAHAEWNARKAEVNGRKAGTPQATLAAGAVPPSQTGTPEKDGTTLTYALIGGSFILLAVGLWLYSRSKRT